MGNEDRELQVVEVGEMSRLNLSDIKDRVQLIAQVMRDVMQGPSDENPEGVHYGVIPGVKKPSLYQPGAQKLCIAFKFDPEYERVAAREDPDFIMYEICCTLYHQETKLRVASGLGACNSREDKYRWTHKVDPVDPQRIVPGAYWDARKAGDSKEMKRIIGEGFRPSKIDGLWVICYDTKIENDNPWNYQNTILKMACKRAFVAATLNGTGASDIFTQDVEDMDGLNPERKAPVKTESKKTTEEKTTEEKPADPNPPDTSEMSEPEKEYADLLLLCEANLAPTPFKNVKATLDGKPGVKENLLHKLTYLRDFVGKQEWGKK